MNKNTSSLRLLKTPVMLSKALLCKPPFFYTSCGEASQTQPSETLPLDREDIPARSDVLLCQPRL